MTGHVLAPIKPGDEQFGHGDFRDTVNGNIIEAFGPVPPVGLATLNYGGFRAQMLRHVQMLATGGADVVALDLTGLDMNTAAQLASDASDYAVQLGVQDRLYIFR